MTLIFILILGGLGGWVADKVTLSDGKNTVTANVIAGATGALIGGWLMMPTGGLPALLGAMLGAGLLLSIVNLMRRRSIP